MESRTHISWRSMIDRCRRTTRHNFARYGGRGITICERWNDYGNFLADMGERPEGKTLDRIDNDRGYDPSNCRWATPSEQTKNRETRDGVHSGPRPQNIAGKRFGMLVAVVHVRTDNGRQFWSVRCDCGNDAVAQARQMIRGFKKSCGCLQPWQQSSRPSSQVAAAP